MKKRVLIIGILLIAVFLILMFGYGSVIIEKTIYTGRLITGWDSYGNSCTPSCSGKVCGSDGCGGSCGSCGSGESCSGGQCIASCVPSCSGKVCGSDGCGGICGSCSSGKTCSSGQCVASCVPSCTGKVCGDNGCGGSCGSCESEESCSGGQCVFTGTLKQCGDGIDNDGDELIDFEDWGCYFQINPDDPTSDYIYNSEHVSEKDTELSPKEVTITGQEEPQKTGEENKSWVLPATILGLAGLAAVSGIIFFFVKKRKKKKGGGKKVERGGKRGKRKKR